MRSVSCKFEDGNAGHFVKMFDGCYGHTENTTLSDAFSSFMPHGIYNAWINGVCDVFALVYGREAVKICANDNLLTLSRLCNDDEATTVYVNIYVLDK